MGDSINLFQIYYNPGYIISNIKEYIKANEIIIKVYLLLLFRKEISKSFALSAKAGLMVKQQLKYDSALIYYNMSTALFEEDNNIYGLIKQT